jgi:hypothetical protein
MRAAIASSVSSSVVEFFSFRHLSILSSSSRHKSHMRTSCTTAGAHLSRGDALSTRNADRRLLNFAQGLKQPVSASANSWPPGILLLPNPRSHILLQMTSAPRCRKRVVNHRPRCLSFGGEPGVRDRCRLRAGIARYRLGTSVRFGRCSTIARPDPGSRIRRQMSPLALS